MERAVREPIQVYLTPEERQQLDRAATALGVSRSEVLRRGIVAVGSPRGASSGLREMAEEGYLTLALTPTGIVPPRVRKAPFAELMVALDEDREER